MPEQAGPAPPPIHRRSQCAVRRPAEPADDSALRIVQRLDLASAVGGELGIESEII